MAVISITYNEGGIPLDYKSTQVSYNDLESEKVFDSGNFVIDWFNLIFFIIDTIGDSEHIMHSSSVDHFIFDGAPFKSAYLLMNETTEIWDLVYEYDSNGIEFFINEDTNPTWVELKEYCNFKKQN